MYVGIYGIYMIYLYLSDLYYILSSPVHIPIQSLPLSYLSLSNYMDCPESQWPMNGKTCRASASAASGHRNDGQIILEH